MRCLHVHNDYIITGGETKSTQLIGNLLEDQGVEIIRYYKKNSELRSPSLFNKIYYGFNSVFNFQTKNEIERILKKEKIDFAIIHNVTPIISNSIYYVLKKNNIPMYKYVQNYNLICLNGAMDCSKELCSKCIKKRNITGLRNKCYKDSFIFTLIKLINKFIFDIYYKDSIKKYISISKFVENIHRTYNFNEIITIYHFIESINEEVRGFPLQKEKKYYLYMGRLSEEKGIRTLLEAFKLLKNETLFLMGDGELLEEVYDFINSHNLNIEFIGYKTGIEKEEIIRNAYCTIVPSEWDEPFGRIVIESYSHGIPVIATDRGGLNELVDEGITGFKYESGNIDELVNRINSMSTLTKNEYQILKENCIKICKEKFSKEAYYKKFINLLN